MSDDPADEFANDTEDQSAYTAEVAITGPGISITRPVDEAMMSSIIALLFGATTAPTAAVSRQGSAVEGTPGQAFGTRRPSEWDEDLTLGEFVVETGAKTFPQKICAAGYYLMKYHGVASFSREDVRSALAEAHEDMPANFGRDFTSAASSHLVAPKQGESGQFIVPRTGRTAVESNFQDAPKRRTARRTAKRPNTNGSAE